MPINWIRTDYATQQNGLHYQADFVNFDAVIGVDRTNINAPVFYRFGKDSKVNITTLDAAKEAVEVRLQQYIKSLTT